MPTLAGFSPSITFLENTVNATPQLLDGDVVFTDLEGDFDGGMLVLSGLLAEDRASVRNEGVGAGQIGLSGANVTFGGVVIGALAGGVGTPLTITFNAAATTAAIDALIQNLTYANVSDIPTGSRNLTLDIIDASGRSTPLIEPSSFAVQVDNPTFSIDIGNESRPDLADLDGDGDLDLVIGSLTGTVAWFENTGTPGAPVYLQRTGGANPFDGLDVGARAAPILADLDGDGDLDALIGNEIGVLTYLENTGTHTSPVFVERTGAANPLSGFVSAAGTTSTRTELADVDGDGDLDLLVATSASGVASLRYLENTGSTTTPVFTEQTGAANPFDGLAGTGASLIDRDNDGDLDLVLVQRGVIPGSGGTQGALFNYFENVGSTGNPQFVQRTGSDNPFEGLASTTSLTATFGDRDGDGDLDIILGQGDGRLVYAVNTTQPSGGAVIRVNVTPQPDSPGPDDQTPATSFGENLVNDGPQRLEIDPATALFIRDGNFNGDRLIITGLSAEDRISVRTEGNGAGQIALNLPNVPPGTIDPPPTTISFGGVVIGTFSTIIGAPAFTFNASATTAAIEALIQNLTYANVSDAPTASRTLRLVYNDAFATPLSGVDVGSNATPVFADLDGDGDSDVVVGELDGVLNWFENTGTLLQPVFVERTGVDNPLNGIDIGASSTPTFADLDSDGDLDLIVGETDGVLNFFENTGTATAPAFVERTGAASPFTGIDVGAQSSPTLGDIDGDGDLDMFVGDSTGLIRYFENTGTTGAAAFTARTGAANPLDGLDVGSFANPLLVDIDGDGDLDLLIGRDATSLRRFFNTGDAETPTFVDSPGGAFTITTIAFGSSGAPAMADIDGDGDLDTLVGIGAGGLGFSQIVGPRPVDPSVVVTVAAENDRPVVANLPLDLTVTEDVESSLDLSALTLSDGDPSDGLTVVMTASEGTLTSADAGGVTVVGSGSSTLTLTGTAAAIDAFLNTASSVRYLAGMNVNGGNVAGLTITADDGSGPIQLGTVNIDIAAVNDAPTLGDLAPTITFLAAEVAGAPRLLDSDVTFIDPDDAFDGGGLTVTGLLAEDRVSIRDQGVGAGQIGLSGVEVTFGGVVIGTVAGGVGGALVVSFNPAATSAAVEALIENLTYANASGTPTASRTLVLNIIDADGAGLVSWEALTGSANPVADVDTGSSSDVQTLADIDGDGDLDIVVGSYGGDFRYFENTGSPTAPAFAEQTGAANPFEGVYGGTRSRVSLADLDGDGDLDALSGGAYGSPRYYENVGSATAPVYEDRSGGTAPFDVDGLSGAGVPMFADLDGDGDLDAVGSPSYGSMRVFENTGSATAPAFVERTGSDNPFESLSLGSVRPGFADMDGDGDIDVVFGSSSGGGATEVIYFENVGAPGAFDFVRRTGSDNPLFGIEPGQAVSPGDLNGDGVPDLIISASGALRYVGSVTGGSRAIVVTVSAQDASINGDANDNVLVGTAQAETINGMGGDDTLSGRGGDDTMDGGAGNDTADYRAATSGTTARLNHGQTTNDGDGGSDTLISIENILGSDFNDLLVGDANANRLDGGLGADVLLGLAGDDILIGGAGSPNQMQGGLGDDLYVVSANDTLVELAGEGTDTVRTDLAAYVLKTHFENLTHTGNGAFRGTGNAADNVITGGTGRDILIGLDGDDRLIGGGGVDTLDGGAGSDTADYAAAGGGVSVRLAVQATLDDGGGATDTLGSIENVIGSAFNDLLFGGSGANVISGGLGADILLGLGGDDILIGGTGVANQMQGGVGDDTYVVEANDTLVEFANEGVDTVRTSRDAWTLAANIENLVFTGASAFAGRGNGLANIITGGEANDTLTGGLGDDTLNGGGGSGDIIVMAGVLADYTVTDLGGGSYRIVDAVNGRDGTDTTTGVERVRFATGPTVTLSSIATPAPAPPEPVDKDTGGPLVLPGVSDDGFMPLAKAGDLPLVLPGADATDETGFEVAPSLTLRPGHMLTVGDEGLPVDSFGGPHHHDGWLF